MTAFRNRSNRTQLPLLPPKLPTYSILFLFSVTTNNVFPLSSKSNPFICALALLSSHFLMELVSLSVLQRQFLRNGCGIGIQTSSSISSHWIHIPLHWLFRFCFLKELRRWLLSLFCLIFFPQFTPIRILLPLNCDWDHNYQGYQRSPSNQIQVIYVCLFFSFLAPQQYSIPPSVSKHLLLLPHTVITSDLHDTKFIFFLNCYIVIVSSGYCGRWTWVQILPILLSNIQSRERYLTTETSLLNLQARENTST